MPPTTSYSLKIMNGLTFIVDASAGKLYAYEKNPTKDNLLCIGTFDEKTETYTLNPSWKEDYTDRLNGFRQNEKPRLRVSLTK